MKTFMLVGDVSDTRALQCGTIGRYSLGDRAKAQRSHHHIVYGYLP